MAARILRNDEGGWSVTVQAHKQTPGDLAELAEQVETLVRAETAGGASVRLGRKLADSLSPEDASSAERLWLEGCVWAWARTTGLNWDRMRCAVAAEILRTQPKGWQRAVAQVVKTLDTDPD